MGNETYFGKETFTFVRCDKRFTYLMADVEMEARSHERIIVRPLRVEPVSKKELPEERVQTS